MNTPDNNDTFRSTPRAYTREELEQLPEAEISAMPLGEDEYSDDEVVDFDEIGTVYFIEGENVGILSPDGTDYQMVVVDVEGDNRVGLVSEDAEADIASDVAPGVCFGSGDDGYACDNDHPYGETDATDGFDHPDTLLF